MAALAPLRRHLATPALRRRWLVAAYALALSPLPLIGALGYESSVALTAPLAVLGVFVGVDAARAAPPALDAIARHALADLAALCGAPLLVLALAQAYNPSCDPWAGLAFFFMGPVLSAILGAIAGAWGAALVHAPPRRALQVLVGLTPHLFCLLLALLRLYNDPVVFAADPFWGYFAGPLYDEGVRVDERYLLFRLYNLLLAAAALAALRIWGEPLLRRASPPLASHDLKDTTDSARPASWTAALLARPWAAAALVIGLGGGAWLGLRPAASGFHATQEGLEELLPATRVTEHFVLHYSPTSATAREIDVVAAEHEFAWHRLAAALGRAPTRPIHAFIFPTPELKRQAIGAGHTEVAPPWRLHLYLNHQPFPAPVMPHELAHAFSSVIGDPVFGVAGALDRRGLRLNMALVEGFATALAPRPRDGLDLHDMAAALDRLDLRPDLAGIMGVAFWGQASRRAYTAAGSFCRWLLEEQGPDRLAALYRSAGDFDAVYGRPLADLEAAWIAALRARPLHPQDIEAMRQIFEQRSIFQRPCAHRSAALRADAALAAARGLDEPAIAAAHELCAIEPERPEHRLHLAVALAAAGRLAEAAAPLRAALAAPGLTTSLRALAHQHQGDLALAQGDLTAAAAAWQAALAASASEEQARALQVRLVGARDPKVAPLLRDYFLPFEPAALRATAPLRRLHAAHRLAADPRHAPLGAYLLGLQLLGIEEPAAAAPHLARALAPRPGEEPLPSPELLRAARAALVNALVRLRAYDRAAALVAELLADPAIGNGHRQTYREWADRIDFFRAYLPAPPGALDPAPPLPALRPRGRPRRRRPRRPRVIPHGPPRPPRPQPRQGRRRALVPPLHPDLGPRRRRRHGQRRRRLVALEALG